MDMPLQWIPPETFQNEAPGLGFPVLEGCEHTVIYDPLPCHANVNEGGDGRYESLRHGTYSHGPNITLFEDKFIVQWYHHSRDEDAAGTCWIAKVGTFADASMSAVQWGGIETMADIVPQAAPLRHREWHYDPELIDGVCARGGLRLINGRLYVIGNLSATHGFLNDRCVQPSPGPGRPIPAANWCEKLEGADWRERRNSKGGPWGDVYWDMGGRYVRRWRLDDNRTTLIPDSPMYVMKEPVTSLEVTPGRVKRIIPLIEPYTSALPFAQAPADFQDDVLHGKAVCFRRSPKYASALAGMQAADGNHGLAHNTVFKRPDGKWVVLRDNLRRMGHYYAAVKDNEDDCFPLAIETNLPGAAMPAAGELPNGWVWVLGNKRGRREMYLALSRDGIVFDRTWSILTLDGTPEPGSIGKAGGPQYFHAIVLGDNIWVTYSITKMQIGVTRIPIGPLLG